MREKATSSQIKPCHEGATGRSVCGGGVHPTQERGTARGEEQLQVGKWSPWEVESWASGWAGLRGRSSRALPATGPLSTRSLADCALRVCLT